MVSALRIGAGRETAVAANDLPVMRDLFDRPYIPGSSIKGVVRSYIESIVRSLWPHDDRKGRCNPVGRSEFWCVPDTGAYEDGQQRVDDDKLFSAHCPVCRLFGSPWIASKVSFIDAPVVADTWFDTYIVRDGVAIDRDLGTAAGGLKYDFEVVPGGTEFDFEVRVENACEAEVGLLYLGISALGRGELSLGGMTSRGPGVVELVDERWEHSPFSGESADIVSRLLSGGGDAVGAEKLSDWAQTAVASLQKGDDLCTVS